MSKACGNFRLQIFSDGWPGFVWLEHKRFDTYKNEMGSLGLDDLHDLKYLVDSAVAALERKQALDDARRRST